MRKLALFIILAIMFATLSAEAACTLPWNPATYWSPFWPSCANTPRTMSYSILQSATTPTYYHGFCRVDYPNAGNGGETTTIIWDGGPWAQDPASVVDPTYCQCEKLRDYPPACVSSSTSESGIGGISQTDGSSSPIIVSFHGAVRAVSAAVSFDIDADGDDDHLAGWLGEGAFLALDRDGDGQITSGAELFGQRTTGSGGVNGYVALGAFDSNSDGTVTEDEAPGLLLWFDDGNGTSEAAELVSAWSHLSSVATPYRTIGRVDSTGNLYRWTSDARDGDGHQHQTVDVIFARP